VVVVVVVIIIIVQVSLCPVRSAMLPLWHGRGVVSREMELNSIPCPTSNVT